MHKKIYLSVILGILFFVSCKDKKQYYEESGTVFHTHIRSNMKRPIF